MKKRSDAMMCIRQTHAERTAISWCGRRIEPFEWTFTDIDHAIYSLMAEDRLIPCLDCVRAIIAELGKIQ